MKKKYLPAAILLFLLTSTAEAHHALEFIVLDSYSTAPGGSGIFHLSYDYFVHRYRDNDAYNYEITPGISYGITSRLMFDIHTHISKFGGVNSAPFIEAVAVNLQARITKKWDLPFDLGASLTYEYPTPISRDLIEGTDPVTFTLIISRDFGAHSNVVANFSYAREVSLGSEQEFTYGLAIKSPLSPDPHGAAGGIEFIGDFSNNPYLIILPGVYLPVIEGFVFKTGVGFSVNDRADKLSVHFALVYRF